MVMLQSAPEASRSHPLKEILTSRKTGWRIYRFALLTLLVAAGFYNLTISLKSLSPEFVYRKDIIQEYLMARAVLAGVNPYLPCPELAERFIGPLPNNIVLHPTPHPPPMAVLSLPLGLLTYHQAAVLWFLLEFFCLLLSCYQLVLWFSKTDGWPRVWQTGVLIFVLLAWGPFMADLANGQIMIILMILLIWSWKAFISGKKTQGGIFLGIAVALKLIAWPIVVFWAFKRNWRTVGSALSVIILTNFFAGFLIGFDKLADYYLTIGPIISQVHSNHGGNFSAWSIGPRLFSGTGSEILFFIEAPPLVYAPKLARFFSLILPGILLITGLSMAVNKNNFDIAWGILICVTILISPVAWLHYLTLAVMPAFIVVSCLSSKEWPFFESNTSIVIAFGLLFSMFSASPTLYGILQGDSSTIPPIKVTFLQGSLSMVPIISLLGLFWLLGRLDRQCPEATPR